MSRLYYDEMGAAGQPVRPHYKAFADWLERTPAEKIAQKREEAERAFHRLGITFAVYGEDAGTERLIPFDIVPRIIPATEWAILEKGLKQRVKALNLFLHDIYHKHRILKAGIVPAERVLANTQYRSEMQGAQGREYLPVRTLARLQEQAGAMTASPLGELEVATRS